MNCYDCALDGGGASAGIGICSRCNLAVCADHARVTPVLVHRSAGLGRATADRPGRRVVCGTCHAAEAAA
ncbi:DUF2180 family protein [Streptomyces sp. G45]|uniref:DUF2180 family protein n=1 Tax=Streptomyces sp. G45 TaxID=3406627 RepID=UPI003C18E393